MASVSTANAAIGDCHVGTGAGAFTDGNGSVASPYLVATEAQLSAIRTTDCLDENFRQDADIALTGTWTPISGFVGTYDGGGKEITNLVLSGRDAGLFNVGSANAPATVKNLTVRVSSTAGAIQDVGAIVGQALGSLVITNVHVFGDVSGSEYGVGGLVGWGEGKGLSLEVSDSSVTGNVSAGDDGGLTPDSSAGGVVGVWLGSVTISNTRLKGDVTGTGAVVGGLVGDAESLDVSNSTVTGNVSALGVGFDSMVGGVVGYASGATISATSVIGNVTGSDVMVGGLVGFADLPVDISDSFVRGNVSAGDDGGLIPESLVGGVVGYVTAAVTISATSVIGNVTGSAAGVGGLVGFADSLVDVSNSTVTGNVVAGDDGSESLLGGVVGHVAAAVTISATSVIGNVTGTAALVGGLVGEATSTLTVSGSLVTGDVSAGSTGDPDYLSSAGGVVGHVTDAVTISATSVIGNVTGTDERVGGLVGDAPATVSVSGSSVTGNVTGYAFIGGVVGYANSAVSISTTAVIGDVTGDMNGVGGLVGRSFVGPVTTENAFYRGTVTGGCFCFGGIVGSDSGKNNTSLTNTYVAESQLEFVGDFVDATSGPQLPSYVDSFCTGVSAADVVDSCQDVNDDQRVTNAQLKSRSFLEDPSGPAWDFVNVWCVSPNVNGGYPVLRAISTPAVGFAACWAPVAVSTPAAPAPQVRQVTLDPNGGVCMVDGQRRDVSWSTKFVDNHYLPGNKDCEREGFTFEGWADVAKPDVVLDLPKLAQPTDGVTRPFLTRSADLIAVWKKPDETEVDTDDLTGTAPGAFVGGADRRTREGGGVVDGYYIPPNTVFGPWMAMDDLAGTAPGAFVGGADRRTREGGGVVDGYYIPPNTVFGPWMLAR